MLRGGTGERPPKKSSSIIKRGGKENREITTRRIVRTSSVEWSGKKEVSTKGGKHRASFILNQERSGDFKSDRVKG